MVYFACNKAGFIAD